MNTLLLSKKNEIEDAVLQLETKGDSFTVVDIVKKINGSSSTETFFSYTEKQIQRLWKSGKIGNSKVYQYTLNSFKKYRNEKDIQLAKIDYSMTIDYEVFLLENGNSQNTVSVYMRTIRAILNHAIKMGMLDSSKYAFKNFKISENMGIPAWKGCLIRLSDPKKKTS